MYREPTISPKAIAWALLSQSIWLPLLAIDAHDRWQARVQELTPPSPPNGTDQGIAALPPLELSSPPDPLSRPSSGPTTTGHVLSTATAKSGSLLDAPLNLSLDQRGSAKPGTASRSSPFKALPSLPNTLRGGTARIQRSLHSAKNLLQRSFTRSEMLGGVLTIDDLASPAMPPLARAERARWKSTGDPLAPLPQTLREPMRQAIRSLPAPTASAAASLPAPPPFTPVPAAATPAQTPSLQQGKVVYVPSTRVSKPTQVPLALQSDGTVDVLSNPDNPAVIEDIKEWSSRQVVPEKGSVTPAVVNLEPIPPEPVEAATLSTAREVLPDEDASQEPSTAKPLAAAAAVMAPPPPLPPIQDEPSTAPSTAPAPAGDVSVAPL